MRAKQTTTKAVRQHIVAIVEDVTYILDWYRDVLCGGEMITTPSYNQDSLAFEPDGYSREQILRVVSTASTIASDLSGFPTISTFYWKDGRVFMHKGVRESLELDRCQVCGRR